MGYVPPTGGERFYLRTLLTVVRGPQSFEDLLHVPAHNKLCKTYHDACVARGLLEDDGEWIICFEEASEMHTGASLRNLFSTALLFSGVNYSDHLWQKFRHSICDDLPHRLQTMNIHHFPEDDVYDYGLYLLDHILQKAGKSITDFPSMPSFVHNWDRETTNQLIIEQLNWNQESEQLLAERQINLLNLEQCTAFNNIWNSILHNQGQSFFINGPGGTGKTFLERAICHAVRAQGWILLGVASTGLAALLLPGGRTAHSMFKIPIESLATDSICHIPKESQ